MKNKLGRNGLHVAATVLVNNNSVYIEGLPNQKIFSTIATPSSSLRPPIQPNNRVLSLLLSSGFYDVNEKDYEGNTPLLLALRSGIFKAESYSLELVKRLVECGADVNAAVNINEFA